MRDDGEGVRNLGTQSCWGKSTSYDDACYFDTAEDTASFPLAVLARGWARLKGDQENMITVTSPTTTCRSRRAHQLGLVIFGASPSWLVTIDHGSTPYTVDLAKSSLILPIVGELSTADNAGDLSQVPSVVPPGTVADGAGNQELG